MIEKIHECAVTNYDWIRQKRRKLHANPELSFKEFRTPEFICETLDDLGVSYSREGLDTGVLAQLGSGDPCIVLRADIDALPILEKNDVEYKSRTNGIMHACGHDVHTSCLLGAIKILKELGLPSSGTIKCVFQHAEELIPGGAIKFIENGLMKNPDVIHCFGQHVHPPLEAGKIGLQSGPYMGSADTILLMVKGRGGHAAIPMDTIDPVVISASIIQELQQIVSRKSNPTHPSVLSFGKINSIGGSFNVIPNEVEIVGTFRTLDEGWRSEAHRWIKKIATHVAEAHGGECDITIKKGYPVLINDEKVTGEVAKMASHYLGNENVVKLERRLSAEDFAYYGREVPSCFYRLGTGNKQLGITSPIHTDTFDVDEECLKVGAGFMAYLAAEQLKKIAGN